MDYFSIILYNVDKYTKLKTGANAYNTLAITLKPLMDIPKLQEKGLAAHYLIAKIIHQALFCEVALKALVVRDNKEYGRIHNLDELFHTLNQDTQQKIIDKMGGMNKDEFEKLIAENNNHFVKWRYFYEEGATCNVDFMNKCSLAIREVLFDKSLE